MDAPPVDVTRQEANNVEGERAERVCLSALKQPIVPTLRPPRSQLSKRSRVFLYSSSAACIPHGQKKKKTSLLPTVREEASRDARSALCGWSDGA